LLLPAVGFPVDGNLLVAQSDEGSRELLWVEELDETSVGLTTREEGELTTIPRDVSRRAMHLFEGIAATKLEDTLIFVEVTNM
jgi:hypothetical protein